MVGRSYHGGGFVGDINGSSYKLEMNNCLYTGTINFNSSDTTYRVGGVVGALRGGAEVTLIDCMVAGKVISTATGKTGSIIGSLEGLTAGTKLKIDAGNTVYATKECHAKTIGNDQAVTGTGTIVQKQKAELAGTNASDLDFTTYWTALDNDTPVLTNFYKPEPTNISLFGRILRAIGEIFN